MRIRPLFPPEKAAEAQKDLQHGRAGRRKPHMEQIDRGPAAHEIRDGNPHEKRAHDPLDHHEPGILHAVEKADKTEQEAGQKAVDGIRLEVLGGSADDRRIICKYAGKDVPAEKRQEKHGDAEARRDRDGAPQPADSPLRLSRALVLRDERRHRLHERRRDQHDEGAHLFRDADARGNNEAEGIDDRKQHEERNADEKILQRDRRAEPEDTADRFAVPADRLPAETERQFLLSDHP